MPDEITKTNIGQFDPTNHTVSGNFSNNDTVQLTLRNGYTKYLKITQSTLPSISITLNGTSLSVINSGSKDTKYPNNTIKISAPADKDSLKETTGVQVKGRGNSTWRFYKRPYQIKFDKKTSLFGIQKAKKWVLLANATDPSLLRNETAQNIAMDMGLKGSQGKIVDLFVDGEYIGNYYLCQQVDDNLVGLKNEQGILAEMDNIWWPAEPTNYYDQKSNSHFTIKATVADDETDDNNHFNPNSTGAKSFKNFQDAVKAFDNDLYAEQKDWNKISSHIDVDSFAKFYLLQEFTANWDGVNSSMYVYQDGPNDKLHMGPAWDFDMTLGNNTRSNVNRPWLNTGVRTSIDATWFSELLKIPEFQQRVKAIYQSQMVPSVNKQKQNVIEEEKRIAQSADMNHMRYYLYGHSNIMGPTSVFGPNYQSCVQPLLNWLTNRKNYFDNYFSKEHVSYQTHVQNIGWQEEKFDGEVAGTQGQSKRLEAIHIKLENQPW